METPRTIRAVTRYNWTINNKRQFAVSGWRTEKLRNSRQRWIKVNHPPYERSPIKRISDDCEKIMYVTNGTVNNSLSSKWLNGAKRRDNYINKSGVVHTPCLVFCKERYHILLESLAMEEVLELENRSQDILEAFKTAEAQLYSCNDEETIHRPIKK